MNPDRARWAARAALWLALGSLTGCGGCEDKPSPPAGAEPPRMVTIPGQQPISLKPSDLYKKGGAARLMRQGTSPAPQAIPDAGGPDP